MSPRIQSTARRPGGQEQLERIRAVLSEAGFPPRFNTPQTARTILALADDQPQHSLKSGKPSLSDGAVLHDILEFVRKRLKKPVGENTRESYRKGSLKPLRDFGLVQRHQSSPNDPKTYYRLDPGLAAFIRSGSTLDWKARLSRLPFARTGAGGAQQAPRLRFKLPSGKTIRLSPGSHNLLALRFLKDYIRFHAGTAHVAYVGDQARRTGYQDRDLLREINLTLDTTQVVPDAILIDVRGRTVTVVEFVTSVGPITPARKKELEGKLSHSTELGYVLRFVTAFPDRRTFARFAAEVAYSTYVWIADEPDHIVRFNG